MDNDAEYDDVRSIRWTTMTWQGLCQIEALEVMARWWEGSRDKDDDCDSG
jgi:hypothetical protein